MQQARVCIVLLLAFSYCGSVEIFQKYDQVHFLKEKTTKYNPPPASEKAKRARYLFHYSNWGVLSTLSTLFGRDGMPFGNIAAVSDGPMTNSSGVPYFYVSDEDASMQDIAKNNSVSFTVSENQTPYCTDKNYDPEFPLCARLTLCGNMVKITDENEKQVALDALFARFPDMKKYPPSHAFYPARININLVWLLDFFGAATVVPVKDYFAADPLK